MKLNLDAACADRHCAPILEQFLPLCPVALLSLRDNGLEQDAPKLFAALRAMDSLQSLDIGGANFAGLRANKKGAPLLSKALNELVKLISQEESVSFTSSV